MPPKKKDTKSAGTGGKKPKGKKQASKAAAPIKPDKPATDTLQE